MKKPIIFLVAILFAFFFFQCSKDSGELDFTDKSEDGSGIYGGLADGFPTGGYAGDGNGDSTQQEPVNPGQITAAEWNDLMEWEFWNDLGQLEDFNQAKENWRFYPEKRYAFLVRDDRFNPVADCEISLKTLQGDIVWTAKTDNEGKAELWADLYGGSTGQVTATIKYTDQQITLVDPVSFEGGINEVNLTISGTENHKADILFVVDATGSMGDEINYLKAELLDVIERSEELNSTLDLRLGSVFYRDEGDDYLTRVSPLSGNLRQTFSFINNQEASGGGDYEEAVHTALNTAITQLNWSESAKARLLFLLLDAPPHHTEAIVNDLHDIIKSAAERGIKIIPISASGIDKDTEFLFRFFAITTNGTYVFITNDSGIGGEHIEATVGAYEVELLNDLIVRLITKYTR